MKSRSSSSWATNVMIGDVQAASACRIIPGAQKESRMAATMLTARRRADRESLLPPLPFDTRTRSVLMRMLPFVRHIVRALR